MKEVLKNHLTDLIIISLLCSVIALIQTCAP